MSLSIVKPLISAVGASLLMLVLMACNSTHADPFVVDDKSISMSINQTDSGSISIEHSKGNKPTYTIDGVTYRWSDLSEEQQQKLTVVHEKINKIEEKFEHFETVLEPLIEDIEIEAEKIEAIVEAMEPELEQLEDIEEMKLQEIHQIAEDIRAKIHLKEKEIQKYEQVLQAKEDEIRAAEIEFLGKESDLGRELEMSLKEIVEIVTQS